MGVTRWRVVVGVLAVLSVLAVLRLLPARSPATVTESVAQFARRADVPDGTAVRVAGVISKAPTITGGVSRVMLTEPAEEALGVPPASVPIRYSGSWNGLRYAERRPLGVLTGARAIVSGTYRDGQVVAERLVVPLRVTYESGWVLHLP